uniref:EGF-like domain-containing protein n=2 Tax=Phytophthora ramorum TaxID=164328 RepID=H3GRZ6_PHYRM
MLWAATLLAIVFTVAAATEPSTEYLPGDIWADGFLQYRVISQTDAALVDGSSNGTSAGLQGAANELMSLVTTPTVSCVVNNQYTLQITISKCLSLVEYVKVWDISSWAISNANLHAVEYTYLDCPSAVGAYGTPTAVSAPPRIEFMLGTTTPTVPGAVAVRCSAAGQGFVGGVCTACPAGSSVVGGVCTCSGGRSIVNGVCTCPSTSTFVGGACQCALGQTLSNNVCTCPAGASLVNEICQCSAAGQGFVGGVCTACPAGSSVVGGVCTCSGGRSIVNGVCTCPSTSTFVGGACQCALGQTLSNNVCTCPAGASLVNEICQCSAAGQGFVGGVCTACPAGSSVVGGVCTCSGGRSIVNGECTCPSTSTFVGGACQCALGQTLSNNVCTCPAGASLVNEICQCSAAGQGFVGGVCTACPAGSSVVGGVCTCSGGRSIVNGVCTCPSTSTFVGGACQCALGQTLSNNVCTCPAGASLVNEICQCSAAGQGFVGGVCTACPAESSVVGGVCTCSGGRSIVNGECTCLDGQIFENGVCAPSCFWNANNAGFVCPWWNPDKSFLKLEEDCKVVAPVAEDNYVADKRDNKNDATRDDPVIAITATKHGGSLSVTRKATWKDYFLTPTALENEITFTSFGVFDLLMTASDYSAVAKCSGCVAILDTFPPTAVTKCTTTDAQITPVLYSDSLLAEAIAEEAKFTFFYSDGNIVNNGASDTGAGASVRYDAVSAEIQDFFATSVSNLDSVDDRCFDNDFVKYLLNKSPKGSPLTMYSQSELNALQCTRCCAKSLTLQEYYYDYKCGTEFAQTEKKLATSDKCAFKHCLKMTGESLVKASASITTTTADETTKVIAGLPSPVPAADGKTIHSSITCTTFAEGCSFTSTLGDLFHHSSSWSATVPTHDVDDYVFWRYSIDTENWHTWSDAATLTFTTAESTVYVEAWTHCGQAYQDSFKVVLHPHSSHNACAAFTSMWTENSPSPQADVEAHKCAYPGSDFVMMTFAYDSESGAIHDTSTVKGKYTDVKCYVKLAEGGALSQVTETELPLAWPSSPSGRIQISKQLAFELAHDPETAQNTDVAVRCDFTFSFFNSGLTKVEPCPHTFTITDCNDPGLAEPGTEVCELGECESPTGIPGPFEACSGSVFTTVSSSSPLATQMKPLGGECCHDCSTALTCAAVAESTTTGGVKRCEPGNAPGQMMAVALSVEDEDNQKSLASPSTNAMELLVASAMVAVVALVVAKQRMTREKHAASELDNVYVPLLD